MTLWPTTKNLHHTLDSGLLLFDNGSMPEAKYSTYELRVRAVQALLEGLPVSQVAQAYQVDRTTLSRRRMRYQRTERVQGLFRVPGSGRPRKRQEFTAQHWRDVVLQPASAFAFETDFWTAKRRPQVVTDPWAADVTVRTILRRLQEAGLTYQKPTREYCAADPVARQECIVDPENWTTS
jgi:transposase